MEAGSEWVDMNADSEEEVEWDEQEDLLERSEVNGDLFADTATSSSAAPPPPPPQQQQRNLFSKVPHRAYMTFACKQATNQSIKKI
jgi:hypothetical protein